MEKLSKGFIIRTIRAVLFIVLIIIFCSAISSAGIYLASRYGLTQSREQVSLTALSIGSEKNVELPGRGKMVEGSGWKLRNNRDVYTLYLDNAVIEAAEGETQPQPAVTVNGDLILELKDGSGNWIRSEGAGICIQAGTLVIRGKGSLTVEAGEEGITYQDQKDGSRSASALRVEGGQLDVRGRYAGIHCPVVELAGGSGLVAAGYWSGDSGAEENAVQGETREETQGETRGQAQEGMEFTDTTDIPGIGIHTASLTVEKSIGVIRVEGNGAAVIAAGPVPGQPSLHVDKKVSVLSGDTQGDIKGNIKGDPVTYDNGTSSLEGAVRKIVFSGE